MGEDFKAFAAAIEALGEDRKLTSVEWGRPEGPGAYSAHLELDGKEYVLVLVPTDLEEVEF